MERTSLARFELLTSSAATSNTSNRHQRHFHHHHHHHHHLKQCYHYHHHYQHPPEQELTHGIFTNHHHHHHHHHHQAQARPPIVTKTITKTTAKEVSLDENLRINSLDTNTPKLSVSSRFLRLGRKLLLFLFLVCAFTCVALYAIVSASCCTVLTFTDGTTAFQLGPTNTAGRYVVAATGNRENENRDPNHVFPVSSNNNRILPNPGRKTFRAARSNSIGSGVTVDVSPTKTGTKVLNGARTEGHRGDPATTSLPKSPFRFATAPQNVKKSGGRKGKRKPVSVGTGSDVAAAVAASHAYRGRISSDVGHTKSTRGRNAIFLGRERVPNIGKGRKSEKTKKTTGNDTNKSKPKNKRKTKTEEISKTSENQKNGSKNDWRATSAGSSREIIGNARNDHEALLSSSASSSLSSGSQGSLNSARKITPALPSYGNRSHSPRGAETISKNNSQKEKFTDETKEDNPDDYDEIYDIDEYEGEDLSLNYDQEWSTNDEKERPIDGIEFNLNVNESKNRDNSEWMRDNSDNLTETTENVKVRRPLHIQRIRQNATKKLPQAIIIGVKKCGTRALLEYLRLHPDMKGTGPEPHFFDRHYHKGLDWYRNKMPPTIEGQMTIEKTPSYFITKEVPKRIFNMSKNMKILVIVRDPITRAISDYAQLASKRVHMQRFEDLAFVNTTTRIVDTAWNVIRIGVYAKFLERWLHYFPLSQMHFVSGEELISDPASELSRVQDFLGLKRIISEKHFYFNETKGFPCLKKTEGSGHPHCLGKTKGRPHPTVDPMVLKRLRDFYRPFNAKFYHMVQRNFNWP